MPIPLGILAVAGAGAGGLVTSFDLLETTVLGTAAASVTFSNLNTNYSTYKHLQIRHASRGSSADQSRQLRVRLNSDTGSNYAFHALEGFSDGTFKVASSGSSTQTFARIGQIGAASLGANVFTSGVIDILDAFSSNKNTTLRNLSGFINSSSAFNQNVELSSGLWNNTAAITTIELFLQAGNFVAGSRFSLYGIK